MESNRRDEPDDEVWTRSSSSAFEFSKIGVALFLLIGLALNAKGQGIYSGASMGSDGTVYGWGVTNVPGSPGYMYHYNYISGTLSSPGGRQASGSYNAVDYARYDVSLPSNSSDTGYYSVQSLSSVWCTAAGAWIVWNALTQSGGYLALKSTVGHWTGVEREFGTVLQCQMEHACTNGTPACGASGWVYVTDTLSACPDYAYASFLAWRTSTSDPWSCSLGPADVATGPGPCDQ